MYIMKAVIVTEENKKVNHKLLQYNAINTVKLLKEEPKAFNNYAPFSFENKEATLNCEIYDVIIPELLENERPLKLAPSDLKVINEVKAFYQRKEQIPQPTAQELYDAKIEEGKIVFDEYRKFLNEAASPYNILGNHPTELIYLTEQLLVVKDEIEQGLALFLANNDIENLKNFNYNDERATQLKTALESFK